MQKLSLALVVLGLCAPLALAQNPAVLNWTGGTEYTVYYGASTGDVIGWDFIPNQTIYATHLGYYTDPNHAGLEGPHQVGIWDTQTQQLLASAVIDRNDPVTGLFHYKPISSLMLQQGKTYTIGGLDTEADNDWYVSGATTLNMAPEVTWTASRYPTAGSLGFTFPALTSTGRGRFGPNFMFVPEPATIALLAFGLVLRRR